MYSEVNILSEVVDDLACASIGLFKVLGCGTLDM